MYLKRRAHQQFTYHTIENIVKLNKSNRKIKINFLHKITQKEFYTREFTFGVLEIDKNQTVNKTKMKISFIPMSFLPPVYQLLRNIG